jgi:plastocyanin
MNASATPVAEPPRPAVSRLSIAVSAHPIRWLLGSLLLSAVVAAGVAWVVSAAGGGPSASGGATASRGFRVARLVKVPARTRAASKSTTDLGKLWGETFRGDAESYEPLARAEAQANAIPETGIVDRTANTLQLVGRATTVTIVANPPNGRDMAFRIAGLENPTIQVRKGTRITVRFVNGDSDSAHGWMLLDPVVQTGGTYHGPKAFTGSYAPILGDPTAAGQPVETIQFVASTTGTYRYECPVPGHAAMGMQGIFKVTA